MTGVRARWLLPLALGFVLASAPLLCADEAAPADDQAIAASLAKMLQAARSVISNNQPLINDPSIGDKGLSGKVVLARTLEVYRTNTGTDPLAGDQTSRAARLLHDEMDSIVEVVDANQDTINAKGVGFKAFIPAVFARLVDEAFARRAGAEASVKVTAPQDLVRNRKSLPDTFENSVITGKFLAPAWPKGQAFEAVVADGDHHEFRMLVPEYYATSCLTCHGSPKGSLDITGYPREGASAGDLGGVISIILAK
ncbi:MAG TPA: DUF3365 domain-containing protein [Acetobacteraceae bacterium]|nr:DUF3365 domain-containing protein [Acetobacteraceae bacterium]